MSSKVAVWLVGWVIAVLAGCTDQDTANSAEHLEDPVTSNKVEYEVDLPHSGAPKIEHPLEVSDLVLRPCDIVSLGQFKGLGIHVELDEDTGGGATCSWWFDRDSPGSGAISGGLLNFTGEGLSSLYAGRKSGHLKLWKELDPIHGYPAVIAHMWDTREEGRCEVTVGVRDDETYDIEVDDPAQQYTKDPCALAVKLASIAVKNLINRQPAG